MKNELVSPSKIKPNPGNPRLIRDEKFKLLVQSIIDFPEMADVRPIVVNTDYMILGGNMRFRAMKEANCKKIPVVVVDWPVEKQKEFIIKDNASFGEWDWEILANEWDDNELEKWGLDVPKVEVEPETEPSAKNGAVIELEYPESECELVKKKLSHIAETPEQAVWILLGLDNGNH